MRRFLDYAAVFLGNIGNYFVSDSRSTFCRSLIDVVLQGQGDQKFIPDVSTTALRKLSQCSETAACLYDKIEQPILANLPLVLGFPSDVAQSAYYPGELRMSQEEISMVSDILATLTIHPENTRLRKSVVGDRVQYDVLQSSVEEDSQPRVIFEDSTKLIRLVRGGHMSDLSLVCRYLELAKESAANPIQE